MKKCLAKDPDERWQSAGDLASELKWIAEGGGSSITAPLIAARASSSARIAWALAALALLAVIALGMRPCLSGSNKRR